MPSREFRKQAVRSFKEQKSTIGVYSVHSTVSGRTWVGASKNLEATRNSCWFQLRNKLHQAKSLQELWNAQGESAFVYQIVDRLDEDVHAIEIDDLLKQRRSDWATRLTAQQLL
ncbi:MAG: GIY-YIG nuclease family protein [Terracidiphilus sp.]